ncbi:hypothetical protein YPPY19_1902, partial [Yersinia pestis PY-19]
MRATTSALSKR